MEKLRKLALALAVQHLAKDAHNLETVLYWADKFYGWLTDGEASADMVSKTELKEMLPTLGSQFKRNRFPSATEIVGYKQAIDDVLRIIDEL